LQTMMQNDRKPVTRKTTNEHNHARIRSNRKNSQTMRHLSPNTSTQRMDRQKSTSRPHRTIKQTTTAMPTTAITVNCHQTCTKLKQLQEENNVLKAKIDKLTHALIRYENPHTPPSRQLYKTRPTTTLNPKNTNRYPGRPKGHKGQTRTKQKIPNTIITPPKQTTCTHCHAPAIKETHVDHCLIEEIPNRQHRQIIDYLKIHTECTSCSHKEILVHPDCPPQGIFGKNAQAQTVLIKFDMRLPFDKISEQMKQQHGLPMSSATAFEITNRASMDLTEEYQGVMSQIRASSVVNVDETCVKVDGKNYWLWVFVSVFCTMFVIRKSRGKNVLVEVLGSNFKGFIGCDGHKAYSSFSDCLQRCWAHLLREAEALAKDYVETEAFYLGLKALFFDIDRCMEVGVPVWMGLGVREEAEKRLSALLKGCKVRRKKARRFVDKVWRGFPHWFSFVVVEGLVATNNVAENALREGVV
jgi:transposase